MKNNCCKDWGLLILRISLGLVFTIHGAAKLFGGLEGFTGALASMGVPAAGAAAVIIALLEFVGGVALLLGILARWSGLVQALIMFFAIVLVHGKNGFLSANGGFEYQLTLLLMGVAIFLLGSGKYGLDYFWKKQHA